MKKLVAVLLSVALVMSLAACAKQTADTAPADAQATEAAKTETQAAAEEAPAEEASTEGVKEIKVGVILPLSGTSAYQGNLNKEGYEYAFDYYNEHGGIKSMGGAKLVPVYADHTGVPEVGATELERLINVEKCDILTGGNSSTVLLACEPIIEKNQIPFIINQGSSLSILTSGYEYIFNPSNDARTNVEGLIGVCEEIEEKYGDVVDGIGLIMENTEWGQSQSETFQSYFENAGKKVLLNEVIEVGASDFSSQILKIKQAGVKFVVPCISSFNDAVLFVRQMKEYECTAGILASGGVFVVPEFADAVGDNLNYVFSTDTWNSGFLQARGAHAEEVHQGYIDRYGHKMGENAGMSWIAVSVMVAALEAAGTTDGPTVQQTLHNMNLPEDSEYMELVPFHGMKFDEIDASGSVHHNIYGLSCISQFIDGEWKCVWPDDILGGNNPLVWPIPTK